jgi:type VI protein secretion system component VasK
MTREGSEGKRRVRRWRERERPPPSSIWQTVGIGIFFFAVSTAVVALTVSDGAPLTRRELWIITAGLLTLASTMFLAHWDVNRGRRSRHYEREELPPLDSK